MTHETTSTYAQPTLKMKSRSTKSNTGAKRGGKTYGATNFRFSSELNQNLLVEHEKNYWSYNV